MMNIICEAVDASDLKKCTRCHEVKRRSEFHKHAKAKDRLQWHCKKCDRERRRERREKNLERELARQKKYSADYRARAA
jgi:hypothetical protein